jgi:hypothetical protein
MANNQPKSGGILKTNKCSADNPLAHPYGPPSANYYNETTKISNLRANNPPNQGGIIKSNFSSADNPLAVSSYNMYKNRQVEYNENQLIRKNDERQHNSNKNELYNNEFQSTGKHDTYKNPPIENQPVKHSSVNHSNANELNSYLNQKQQLKSNPGGIVKSNYSSSDNPLANPFYTRKSDF